MDKLTQKVFDRLTALDLQDLNDDNKAFIRARRTYLSPSQKEKFESILIEPKEKVKKIK